MKKIALLVAAMAVSSLASAQFCISGKFGIINDSQNTRLLNGDKFDGNYQDRNDFEWAFAPCIGYLFEDYEVGVSLSLGSYTATRRHILSDNLYDQTTASWGLGAYGRYYFGLTDRLSFFSEVDINFSSDKYTVEGEDDYSKSKFLTAYLVPGLSFDINEHWSVESYFSFLNLSWNNEWENSYDEDGKLNSDGTYGSEFNFAITSGLDSVMDLLNQISIGVCYTF